jgi:hypothetical protein
MEVCFWRKKRSIRGERNFLNYLNNLFLSLWEQRREKCTCNDEYGSCFFCMPWLQRKCLNQNPHYKLSFVCVCKNFTNLPMW